MDDAGYEVPDLSDVSVTKVLFALSDDARLRMIKTIRHEGEVPCGALEPGMPKATRSHHLKVLREAGLTWRRRQGTTSIVRLREDELAEHFPGLLDAILDRTPVAPH